jgi:hypothetical protein
VRDDRNADFKRAMRNLIVIIAVSVAVVLGLVWYLWEHSPKPP